MSRKRSFLLPSPARLGLTLALLVMMMGMPAPMARADDDWTPTGNLNTAHYYHTATLLQDGKVLVAGGWDAFGVPITSAELYDPATGAWTPTTSNLNTARAYHTATLLQDGKVLVASGWDATLAHTNSAELYNPATGLWTTTGNLNTARHSHTATLLQDGKVLVAGGGDAFGVPITSAELYNPATTTTVGGHTEPVSALALLWPWLTLVAAVVTGAIAAVALKRRMA